MRVAGGAIAQILLGEFGVSVQSGVASVGEISCGERLDFDLAARSEIFSLGNEEAMKDEILSRGTTASELASRRLSAARRRGLARGYTINLTRQSLLR